MAENEIINDENKKKKKRPKKTKKQKLKILLKVLIGILIAICVIGIVTAIVNAVYVKSAKNFVKTSIRGVEYTEQLKPEIDEDGYYTFTTDEDLKVMQLTDVHIGAGYMSVKKDNMAINAVAAMISEEKPDLVIVTGDIAYPVPFQAGTFNNRNGAIIFAELMEKLGVYWAPAFGNHDTEAYSYFSREDVSKVYNNKEKYPHCLFQAGPKDVDGFGNYMIKVKNSANVVTQSLILLDSHSYVDNDYLGIMWKYDTIHENQVSWYESELKRIESENNGVMPKSLCFFHIPIPEYKTAWDEYVANGEKDTDKVKYIHGKAGESGNVVFTSNYNYGFFDKAKELGSTQGMFCGHDHLNNFSIDYDGIRLTYGYSVDYLAYNGIMKYGLQRGCTIIDVKPDGSFDCHLENYYQDKYKPVADKEKVLMEDYQ